MLFVISLKSFTVNTFIVETQQFSSIYFCLNDNPQSYSYCVKLPWYCHFVRFTLSHSDDIGCERDLTFNSHPFQSDLNCGIVKKIVSFSIDFFIF